MQLELIKQNLLNKEIDDKNFVFEDKLNSEEKAKINEKATELLTFLSGKSSGEIHQILENLIIDDVSNLENQSEILLSKIGKLENIENSDVSNIGKSIIKLNEQLSKLNPSTFKPSKILSLIPFIGNPINRYLKKFQSAKGAIEEICENLQNGAKLLKDDNLILLNDREFYKNRAISLQRKGFVFGKLIDAISENLDKFSLDERKFYENNVLLNLRKKTRSIYEILAVTQQGLLSSDQIINTNLELIDAISNIKIVTKRALEIGVATAISLENQKQVATATKQSADLANEIILQNAKTMNEQTEEIFNLSSSATLSLETLKSAFEQIEQAINKMDELKNSANEKLKVEIANFKDLTHKLEEKTKLNEKIAKYKAELDLQI
ncbi:MULTISPECIES: toxic anion resistance protein [unclassified Campylobacter]|uniref:toxic anion resistance protein n=1 Tax=unclassified Campylobacter TaxID=2593542 RepID=UPI0022E99EA1|nr:MULTISPECIES: toxic anion resistance protein [unclassified Campylobacter]MDA3061583.1 toxic anion resistance protein [Campylobacter sp. JMF_14 EL1]MDA3073311.1 toxic anion resistance protein [Campylobacter sp. JMF_10 EL2]